MHARARTTLVTLLAVVSLVLLAGFDRKVAAIDLPNDVDIVWTLSGRPGNLCTGCTFEVVGAPRLFMNADSLADLGEIEVRMTIEPDQTVFQAQINLNVLDGQSLRPILVGGVPLILVGRNQNQIVPGDTFSWNLDRNDFANLDVLSTMLNSSAVSGGLDLILTLQALVEINPTSVARVDIVVSAGPAGELMGHWVLRDTLGDTDGSAGYEANDIPTRSITIARALTAIETRSDRTRAVDPDDVRPRGARVVGFTHTVDLPEDVTVQGANLRLRLKSDDPLNDVLLLDRGVRDAAAGESCVQAVALSDYLPIQPVPDTLYGLEINLDAVRVMSNHPLHGDPCPPSTTRVRDLRPTLSDGQLDVIVGKRSTVDYSELTITLQDP